MKNAVFQIVMGALILSIVFILNSKEFISLGWETVEASIVEYETHSTPYNTQSRGTVEKKYSLAKVTYKFQEEDYTYKGLVVNHLDLNIIKTLAVSISPTNPYEIYYRQPNWTVIVLSTLFVGLVNLIKFLYYRKFT